MATLANSYDPATCDALVSVSPRTSIEQAAWLMREHDVGALPVVDRDVLVGIVTDRDMVVRGLAERRDGWISRVSDIMTTEVFTCRSDDEPHVAAMIMALRQVRRVLVVDEAGRLTGIVSLADLVRDTCEGADFAIRQVSAPTRTYPPA